MKWMNENSTVLSEFFCKNKLLFKQSADSGSKKIEFNFNLNKYNFYNFLKQGVCAINSLK